MNWDSLTILIFIGLVAYLIITRVKIYFEYKKGLALALERKGMHEEFFGQTVLKIYLAIIAFFVAAFIYVIVNRASLVDFYSWLLIVGVFIITFAVDLIRVKVTYTAIFNEFGLFAEQEYVRFNSIKEVNKKGLGLTSELVTFNSKSYLLPTRVIYLLKDKINLK